MSICVPWESLPGASRFLFLEEKVIRRVLSLLFLSFLFLVPPTLAEDPVFFADSALKAAVEAQLWISDPTPTDMLGLTELVRPNTRAQDDAIADLTGLEYAENLQTLNLRYHLISDLSILSGLSNLQALNLSQNRISDISSLSDLSHLRHLDLHGNFSLSDISAVSGISNLQTLVLRWNSISDLSALSGLADLQTVILHQNEISDISSLATLTSLTELDLRENPLNREACDIYIPQIMANNPGIDFEYDPCVRHQVVVSSTAGGSVTAPGEGEFTFGHGERIRFNAEADPDFVFVNWSGTYFDTANPVYISIDQDTLIQANFESLLDTIYVDNSATNDPGAGDSQETGTIKHPFDSIQEAIDGAAEGTCIVVRAGTYCENIDFHGKRIRVTGIDPGHPDSAGYPILRAVGNGPVVKFTSGEDPDCMLMGFVITGGLGSQAEAILCSASSPTIANCLIVGNRAADPNGAAIYCTDSHAVFVNCTIADNCGGEQGGGLGFVDSPVTLANSIVWNNTPGEIIVTGAGEPLVSYSDILGGWPGPGNLDADPLFVRRGYWTDPDDPSIVLEPSNLKAVWIAGDYHLKSQARRWEPETQTWIQDKVTSLCINAGDPLEAIRQETYPNGDVINMGAFGGTAEASKSY